MFKGVTGQGNLFDLDAFTFGTGTGGTTQTVEGEAYTSTLGVQPSRPRRGQRRQDRRIRRQRRLGGYSSVNTAGATAFSARVSSGGPGGTIQIRSGSATGTLLGSVNVANTGSWDTFVNVSTTLTGSASGALFLSFTGGSGALLDVDTLTITK
ncbi:carbohydrate-binding protein [Streptosporangium lutulentum]